MTSEYSSRRPGRSGNGRIPAQAAALVAALGGWLLPALPVAALEIYHWVDEDGVAHYSQWRPELPEQPVETLELEGARPADHDQADDIYDVEATDQYVQTRRDELEQRREERRAEQREERQREIRLQQAITAQQMLQDAAGPPVFGWYPVYPGYRPPPPDHPPHWPVKPPFRPPETQPPAPEPLPSVPFRPLGDRDR